MHEGYGHAKYGQALPVATGVVAAVHRRATKSRNISPCPPVWKTEVLLDLNVHPNSKIIIATSADPGGHFQFHFVVGYVKKCRCVLCTLYDLSE